MEASYSEANTMPHPRKSDDGSVDDHQWRRSALSSTDPTSSPPSNFEHFHNIMFLMSNNRVGALDRAFQSPIHATIHMLGRGERGMLRIDEILRCETVTPDASHVAVCLPMARQRHPPMPSPRKGARNQLRMCRCEFGICLDDEI